MDANPELTEVIVDGIPEFEREFLGVELELLVLGDWTQSTVSVGFPTSVPLLLFSAACNMRLFSSLMILSRSSLH